MGAESSAKVDGNTTGDEQRRRYVVSKFGAHGYETGAAMVKPHRCRDYARDLGEGFSSGDMWGPFSALVRCLWSSPGLEPPRHQFSPANVSSPSADDKKSKD